MLGGLLSGVDWRLVFLINVPLAITTILLTLRSVPNLQPLPGATRSLDYPGVLTFGLGVGLLVFALTQGSGNDWGDPLVYGALIGSVVSMVAFVVIEHRVKNPLIDFALFRHLNFLAANISQFLAGMVELGMGFLLPAYLLLVIGVAPAVAGLALIPATLPIILAGPLSGKAFDRMGGRAPLVVGFLVLAASGVALGLAAPSEAYPALIPGLILQGFGLGIVLTVNDPTGLTAVPQKDQGQAAGMINTTEQMGGALGIAVLSAVMLDYYWHHILTAITKKGYGNPTEAEIDQGRAVILEIEEKGRNNVTPTGKIKYIFDDVVTIHAHAYAFTFFVAGALALIGAGVCFALVRKKDRIEEGAIFTRRSRWVYGMSGRSPAITKRPDPDRH